MAKPAKRKEMLWAYLIHLGYNMWSDREAPEWGLSHVSAKPYLRCDPEIWKEAIDSLAQAGANMVVIDLGEGIRYKSHPELAVRGSWTRKKLRNELARMRDLGLEPIPKLNFSATHDVWLGPYARCVSTDTYYRVCADLIEEVIEVFDKPRLFHLGMDEETAQHQRGQSYVVIRQYELWWHDFHFLRRQVQKKEFDPGYGPITSGTISKSSSRTCPNRSCRAIGTTGPLFARKTRMYAPTLTWMNTGMTRCLPAAIGPSPRTSSAQYHIAGRTSRREDSKASSWPFGGLACLTAGKNTTKASHSSPRP